MSQRGQRPAEVHNFKSRLENTGTAYTGICSLLEGAGQLQDAPIVIVAANNLDSDGQAAAGERAGHRTGRISHR